MISKKTKESLEKMHYGIAGNHSAVQVCRWTKNSLNGKGACWKEKFYGIKSHRCCQMSPAVIWCENSCLHCWRTIDENCAKDMKNVEINKPKYIIDEILKQRKKLMTGFKGDNKISRKKYFEAIEPTLFTFSLSGEPTLYPKLGELIREIRKRKAVTFVITNGLNPEMLKKLEKEKSLPTQLTISMNAPNEKLYSIWHRSKKKDAWKEFNKSLEIMKKLKGKTRRAIRLTLVRPSTNSEGFGKIDNMSEELIPQYANLIKKAEPDFVHVKGFKSIGYSRKRFDYSRQPFDKEIQIFANKLKNELNQNIKLEKDKYKILGKESRSCVVVLGKNKKDMKIKEGEI